MQTKASLSRELHTPGLLPAHVPVGYWWQNTRSSILLLDKYSCDFVSHPNLAWNDPDLKFVDFTGDGHADILISDWFVPRNFLKKLKLHLLS